jgi:hypothetical protein
MLVIKLACLSSNLPSLSSTSTQGLAEIWTWPVCLFVLCLFLPVQACTSLYKTLQEHRNFTDDWGIDFVGQGLGPRRAVDESPFGPRKLGVQRICYVHKLHCMQAAL